jgi:hypothetical protein
VPDFLAEKRQQITARLAELKPQVDEYRRLEQAASALAGVNGSSSNAVAAGAKAVPQRRGPGRPRGSTRKATATKSAPKARTKATPAPKPTAEAVAAPNAPKRDRRRKGSGSRSAQARSLVTKQPGITIPELAKKMGTAATYLYSVLPRLEQEGHLRKEGRGWHPKVAGTAK